MSKVDDVKHMIEHLEKEKEATYKIDVKIDCLERIIELRQEYHRLVSKKRTALLVLTIVFCWLYGLGLFAFLPPYIIRTCKRKMNKSRREDNIVELRRLKEQLAAMPAEPAYAEPAFVPAGAVFCTDCGSALSAQDVFCPNCGTRRA